MYAFTEFYEEDGELLFRVECYMGVAKHYTEYKIDRENVRKLKNVLGEDAVKTLTKRFSASHTVTDHFRELGVEYVLTGKGYEDTSSDV